MVAIISAPLPPRLLLGLVPAPPAPPLTTTSIEVIPAGTVKFSFALVTAKVARHFDPPETVQSVENAEAGADM
jgi:hypothetical protein